MTKKPDEVAQGNRAEAHRERHKHARARTTSRYIIFRGDGAKLGTVRQLWHINVNVDTIRGDTITGRDAEDTSDETMRGERRGSALRESRHLGRSRLAVVAPPEQNRMPSNSLPFPSPPRRV